MKTLTFIAALLVASTVHAWEFTENPDRFVSVGVTAAKYSASGGQVDLTGPSPDLQMTEKGSAKASSNDVAVNFRIPASNSLTFDVTYVDVQGTQQLNRAGGEYVSNTNLNGYRASIGLRYYFNR